MKRFLLLSVFFIFVFNSQATIFTVNNESGFDADFSDLASAISNASSGDTLYIQPSSVNYGNASIDKRLFIIGGGHNPDYSPYNSSLSSVIFYNGASSSVLKGLNFYSIQAQSGAVVNDVLISGCRIESGAPINLTSGIVFNNWIFEGNVISGLGASITLTNAGANWIFRNNYIAVYSVQTFFVSVPDGTLFDHNIIYHTGTSWQFMMSNTGNGVVFRNNVMVTDGSSVGSSIVTGLGASFQNNLTYSVNGGFPSLGATNISDVNPNFTSAAAGYSFNYSNDYHIVSGSQGSNSATDGTDIGLYGGIFNFSMKGFDAGTPRVEDFTLTTPSAPAGGTITIHLKAHGSGQ